ncbi:Amidohydrolase 2 [Mycena indigotica]|uniref:Amidohydrolase 2 n=1 Tax=Mycena indigotica TaxID=2126181 RepID=A0A8H6SPR7_9AGAR|nr:Amidohydrolase 2 [Mycena indigotica]KAF7301735.1 Amidohydrolase 2 [Mycena indigotica]
MPSGHWQSRPIQRIDIHHHYFEATLDKANASKKVGWLTPAENLPWSPQVSLKYMDAHGIDVAILSFPAISSGSISTENREKTRQRNLAMAEICRTHPTRFGFFATLPFLRDVEGALAEIAFALDELGADGISLSSCYGEGDDAVYIGDDLFDAIWRELNHRRTVVFLHGAQTPSSTPYPHPFLGIPVTEVPGETFKAAAHLVVSGRKRKYPNTKIILAHLGGSTPFLAARVAALSAHMGCELSPEQVIQDFQTFYFESALSAHPTTLRLMQSFVGPERILFGTDFPAVSAETAGWYTKHLEDFYRDNKPDLEAITLDNALQLFRKHPD